MSNAAVVLWAYMEASHARWRGSWQLCVCWGYFTDQPFWLHKNYLIILPNKVLLIVRTHHAPESSTMWGLVVLCFVHWRLQTLLWRIAVPFDFPTCVTNKGKGCQIYQAVFGYDQFFKFALRTCKRCQCSKMNLLPCGISILACQTEKCFAYSCKNVRVCFCYA